MKTFEQANLVLMSENERTKKKMRLQLNYTKENLDEQAAEAVFEALETLVADPITDKTETVTYRFN